LPIGKLQLEEGRIATIAIAIAGGVEITGNVANSVGVGTILITSN
jgi:predicted cation transporter